MKLFLYVKILALIFINSLLFAASLGGTVIIDNNDHSFNFNGKTLIIEDDGNTFGTVTVTSTGSFVFPNKVNDNKNHAYNLKLTQLPDNNGYICTINQASGTVFIKDKTDLVISCKGKYYIYVNVSGLSKGDTYSISNNNQTLYFNSANLNIKQSFAQLYYASYTYSLKSYYNYTSLNYNKCSSIINNGVIVNSLNFNIICKTSQFNRFNNLVNVPNGRAQAVVWTDVSGNAYLFSGTNSNSYFSNDLWRFNGTSWTQLIVDGDAGSPIQRFGSVAWTDNSGNAYVFGGRTNIKEGDTYDRNDLWRFNGTSWSQVIANQMPGSPSGRYGAVAWTDNAGNAYVFGGHTYYLGRHIVFNDLWKFNGTNWEPVTSITTAPYPRYGAVVWKDNLGNVYLFGGTDDGNNFSDLWMFDGTNWVSVNVNGVPPNARHGSVAWTDNAGNAYVFAGQDCCNNYNDLWRFNGTSWSKVTNMGIEQGLRFNSVEWTDNAGNAYVFGGSSYGEYVNDLYRI